MGHAPATVRRLVRRALGAVCATAAALILHAPTAAGQASGEVVRGDLAKRADSILTEAAGQGFAGVVLIAKGSEVLLRKGYGLADRANGIPYTSHTVFDVGSITKQFTAAAILRLEADGRLSVRDTLGEYFPAAPPDKAGITLHQLLTHSAGFSSLLGRDYDVIGRDSLMQSALTSPLRFTPGTGFGYSNIGYSMLGAIVEKVSAMPYERFVYERLLEPAGALETGYTIPRWERRRLAHGDENGRDWGTPLDKRWADDGPSWNLRANGGFLSTVDDLHRWHLALTRDGVLPESALATLAQGYVDIRPNDSSVRYGYGWIHSRPDGGRRVLQHAGGNGVFYAMLRRYLDDDLVYVYASADAVNTCPPGEHGVACTRNVATDLALRGALFGESR